MGGETWQIIEPDLPIIPLSDCIFVYVSTSAMMLTTCSPDTGNGRFGAVSLLSPSDPWYDAIGVGKIRNDKD